MRSFKNNNKNELKKNYKNRAKQGSYRFIPIYIVTEEEKYIS
jgi:hypothetical protein